MSLCRKHSSECPRKSGSVIFDGEERQGRQSREFNAPKPFPPYDDSYRYLKALVRGQIEIKPSDIPALENNVLVGQILEAVIRSAKTRKAVKL